MVEENTSDTMCPITGGRRLCDRERCAWWLHGQEACAITVIAAMLVREDTRREKNTSLSWRM